VPSFDNISNISPTFASTEKANGKRVNKFGHIPKAKRHYLPLSGVEKMAAGKGLKTHRTGEVFMAISK